MNKTNVFLSLLAVFCMATSVVQAADPGLDNCGICMDDKPGQLVAPIGQKADGTRCCNYQACQDCLREALRRGLQTCPGCRAQICPATRGRLGAAPVVPAAAVHGAGDDDEIIRVLALSMQTDNDDAEYRAQLAQAEALSRQTALPDVDDDLAAAMAASLRLYQAPRAPQALPAPAAAMRTWQCTRCFVQNEPDNDCCPGCLEGGEWIGRPTAQVIAAVPAPRPMPVPAPWVAAAGGAVGGYGIPVAPRPVIAAPVPVVAPAATWQCTRCLVQNEPDNDCCPGCLEGGEWIGRPE
jgi:hypothetical protein